MTKETIWRNVQCWLGLRPDAKPGPMTLDAVARALKVVPITWHAVQRVLGCTPDGVPGYETGHAVARALIPVSYWPHVADIEPMVVPLEGAAEVFYGKPGSNLEVIDLPYTLFYEGKPVSRMSVNRKVKGAMMTIFERVRDHYGLARIKELGLDVYDGCFNNRNKVGGSTKSMHAYGIAVDMDAGHNTLRAGYRSARFAGREYIPYWTIVEAVGAVSLGRTEDYDWMHFQFARKG